MTRAAGEDPPPLEPWADRLRTRLLAVTARRVPSEAAEDLVHDAMGVIFERGVAIGSFDSPDGLPPLVWCLQVLRNVIGNWYQRNRTAMRRLADGVELAAHPSGEPTPLAALASDDSARAIHEAIGVLDEPCSRYLGRLATGESPAEMAREQKLDVMALYKRLYRCRVKLRSILVRRGILP